MTDLCILFTVLPSITLCNWEINSGDVDTNVALFRRKTLSCTRELASVCPVRYAIPVTLGETPNSLFARIAGKPQRDDYSYQVWGNTEA
jgi:hypothetical protein